MPSTFTEVSTFGLVTRLLAEAPVEAIDSRRPAMRDPRYVKVVEALARDIEECDRAEHQAGEEFDLHLLPPDGELAQLLAEMRQLAVPRPPCFPPRVVAPVCPLQKYSERHREADRTVVKRLQPLKSSGDVADVCRTDLGPGAV